MTVSCCHNNITSHCCVCDLACDVLVGEAHHKAVLGCIVPVSAVITALRCQSMLPCLQHYKRNVTYNLLPSIRHHALHYILYSLVLVLGGQPQASTVVSFAFSPSPVLDLVPAVVRRSFDHLNVPHFIIVIGGTVAIL